MGRFLVLLAFAAVAFLAFGAGLSYPTRRSETTTATTTEAAEVSRGVVTGDGERLGRPPRRNREAVLRMIGDSYTYLPAMLTQSDSTLRRWPDRTDDPVRVYFEVPDDVPGYTPALGRAARDAFARWQRVGGIPVIFRYVPTPANAEVVVRWIPAFAIRRTGQADIVWRSDGWIAKGTLTLATHTHTNRPLPTEAVFTVALHEIGHLLGLGHSDDPDDVMYPSTSVQDLTIRDRRTAIMLYSIRPGSLTGR